jgi:hypothetical protein
MSEITQIDIPTPLAEKFDEAACAGGFSSRSEAILVLIAMAAADVIPGFCMPPEWLDIRKKYLGTEEYKCH